MVFSMPVFILVLTSFNCEMPTIEIISFLPQQLNNFHTGILNSLTVYKTHFCLLSFLRE